VTFWIFAAAITLSVFAAIAMLTSALVAVLATFAARRLEQYTPASRASLLLRLRLLPAAAAVLVAFGVALPIFAWFEPRQTDETLARTLVAGALIGMSLLARGAWRGLAALRATRIVQRDWQRRGRRLHTLDSPLPVYAIDEPFPIVAVVGVRRPSLFIAERVLHECPLDEVRAMIRHEYAHVGEHDNLKRLLICISPAPLRGKALDLAWTHAAEEAADAAAVADRPGLAVALAQALIRVARLVPVPAPPELASAFYCGGSIETRVRRLLEAEASAQAAGRVARPIGCVMAGSLLCLFALAVVLAAPALHQMMESFVGLLP
jgi:hypothetical protein